VSLTVYPSARSQDLVETDGTDSSWIASDGTCLNVAGDYFLNNVGTQRGSFEIALLQYTFEIETQRYDTACNHPSLVLKYILLCSVIDAVGALQGDTLYRSVGSSNQLLLRYRENGNTDSSLNRLSVEDRVHE
jgi:hypothetical protein